MGSIKIDCRVDYRLCHRNVITIHDLPWFLLDRPVNGYARASWANVARGWGLLELKGGPPPLQHSPKWTHPCSRKMDPPACEVAEGSIANVAAHPSSPRAGRGKGEVVAQPTLAASEHGGTTGGVRDARPWVHFGERRRVHSPER